MRKRLSEEDGFGLIELVIAMVVITLALLALVAGFESAAISLHKSQLKSSASSLASQQLELYRALPFTSIALDKTTTDAIGNVSGGSYDSLYATNAVLDGVIVTDPVTGVQTQEPSGTVNDVTVASCGSTPQCSPIQTVTGADGHRYRIESYIVDVANISSIRWTERLVTVVVRDAQATGYPEILQNTSGFDRGPSG